MKKYFPKIILIGGFLCLLTLITLLNYGNSQMGNVHAKPLPSDSCISCHTNPETIKALAPSEGTVSGGG